MNSFFRCRSSTRGFFKKAARVHSELVRAGQRGTAFSLCRPLSKNLSPANPSTTNCQVSIAERVVFPRFLTIIAATVTISASAASGEDATPRMVTDTEASLWNGIAKLHISGDRWCNAVLISEVEALTAAHCLYHPVTKRFADAEEMKVVFGQMRNDYAALRGMSARAILPRFTPTTNGRITYGQVSSDLALLLLDAPVTADTVKPFIVNDWQAGESVTIVGYGRDRPYILTNHGDYVLTPISITTAKIDCILGPGYSGAPVLKNVPTDELPTILGIISSGLDDLSSGKPCGSLVVRIGPRLKQLRARLKREDSLLRSQ